VNDVNRENDLDDRSYQIRDVYAHFGAAMFYAQVLEQGIVNALTFAQVATAEQGTQELFDENFEANSVVTMGKLLRRLGPFLGEDVDLEAALGGALARRNHFAHRFWVVNDRNFMSFSGRELMLAECMLAQEQFQDVDSRLDPVLERYLRSVGITPEQKARTTEESLARMRMEAAALDD
jgi:hypothetical protein